jgi:hypothetical protein
VVFSSKVGVGELIRAVAAHLFQLLAQIEHLLKQLQNLSFVSHARSYLKVWTCRQGARVEIPSPDEDLPVAPQAEAGLDSDAVSAIKHLFCRPSALSKCEAGSEF